MLREAGWVLFVLCNIALWSGGVMNAGRQGDAGARRAVRIDEVSFDKIDSKDQRIYQLCLEGLGEAEDGRTRTKDWPTVEALATRRIPPFTADPVDKAGYTWRLVRDRSVINYIGTAAADPTRPVFLILAIEPDVPDPQAVPDETHHKLADGTMLHVGVYVGKKAPTSPQAVPPLEDGWRRITMASPE
jgi:hypothetical protein